MAARKPATASEQTTRAEAIAEQAPLITPPLFPHESLAAALPAALAHLTVVARGRTADTGSYTYDYADIADVVRYSRPTLAAHGIVALTPVHEHGSGLACTVILLHESGDRMDFPPFPFPQGRDAQATGSMVTYHRRYALTAALGLAAGDDDDGASAEAALPRAAAAAAPSGKRAVTGARIRELADEPRAAVKDWLDASGISRVPAQWSDDEVDAVVEYLDGLDQEATTEPTEAPAGAAAPAAPEDAPGQETATEDPLQAIIEGVDGMAPAEVEGALIDAGVDSTDLGTDAERRRALAAYRAAEAGVELG